MKSLFSKFGLSCLSALVCMPVWAAQDTATSTLSSAHAYVGAELGYDSTRARLDYSDLIAGTSRLSIAGATYGGFLGYQTVAWKQFNLALESFYDVDQASAIESVFDPANTYKKTREYGISLVPGYLVSDNSKVYARMGYVNGRFKALVTGTTFTDNLGGYQIALGYLLGFANNFGIRAEYDYSSYKSVTYPGAATATPGTTTTQKLQYASNEFKMGLEWMLAL